MPLYVVQARGTDQAALENATIVPDGFCWNAFVFAQLWLIYHRLWVPLAIWIVLEVAFILLVVPRVSLDAAWGVDLLAHLFIGFEGQRLRLAKSARRATLIDVVEGRDRDAAEARFFHRVVEAKP